ncbi:MAG: BACON domain-containing protein [Verrucomicrobia bacterium]|nr:BACON domain-containing protein [Verrucomicrobiota bacterium]
MDNALRLSQGGLGPSLDWPLADGLRDRLHIAALVLTNGVSLTVYLDGIPLFSQPTTAKTPMDLRAVMTEKGEIRAYGRPLSAQEVASVSAELAPRVQYFTLSQAAAVPALSTTSESVPAAGGTVQVGVLLPSGVPWTAVSKDSWLSFVLGTNVRTNSLSDTGPQVVFVFVNENNTTDTRQGIVSIAGLVFAIAQAGRTVTLNPLGAGMTRYGDNVNAVISELGGAVLIGILPEAGAAWTLRYARPEDASWVVPMPGNAVGNKDVLFAVSPYNSPLASRTALFNVADKQIRITQRGYTATVTPSATSFPSDGGQGQVQVTVPTSAFWEAVALSPWITILTGQNANGSGLVIFKVASNTGPDRFGTIIVAGEVIRFAQAAGSAPTRPRLTLVGNKLSLFGTAGTTFVIERSLDLRTWETVTQITANGDTRPADVIIPISERASQFYRARTQGGESSTQP